MVPEMCRGCSPARNTQHFKPDRQTFISPHAAFFFLIAEENPEIDSRLFVPDSQRLRCHPLGWDIPAPMGKKRKALGGGSSEGSGANPSPLLRSPRAFSRDLAASWEL